MALLLVLRLLSRVLLLQDRSLLVLQVLLVLPWL